MLFFSAAWCMLLAVCVCVMKQVQAHVDEEHGDSGSAVETGLGAADSSQKQTKCQISEDG